MLTCHPNCQGDEHHPSCEALAWETDTDLWLTGNAFTERRPGGLVRRISPHDMVIREQHAKVERIISAARMPTPPAEPQADPSMWTKLY